MSPEKRQQIIDELWLTWYENGISKKINLLNNTSNEPSKFKTKNWVKIKKEKQLELTSIK